VSDQGATELSRLVGLTRLQFLVSSQPHTCSMRYAPVPALPKLRWLSMMGACSDASFLAALTGLTYLDLLCPSPTILAALPALSATLLQLSLRRSRGPTDACCAHIASLTRLTRLNYTEGVASRRLSDAGFATLRSGLKAIRELHFEWQQCDTHTAATRAGLEALLTAPSLRRIFCLLTVAPGFLDDEWEARVMALSALLGYHTMIVAEDEHAEHTPGQDMDRVQSAGDFTRWE